MNLRALCRPAHHYTHRKPAPRRMWQVGDAVMRKRGYHPKRKRKQAKQ